MHFFRSEDTFWVELVDETVTRVTREPCRCEVKLEKAGLWGSGYASRDGEFCGSSKVPFI